MKHSIYFASPDVFRKDAKQKSEFIKYLCDKKDVNALLPIDSESTNPDEIYLSNIKMIRNCSIVIANLEPFRGPSVDPGVAFEIGYARALDKRIIGYYPKTFKSFDFHRRTKAFVRKQKLFQFKNEFPIIENFNLFDNLMICNSCYYIAHGIHEAIEIASRLVYNDL